MKTATKNKTSNPTKISKIIGEHLPELQPLDNQTMSTILPGVAIPAERILLTRNQYPIDAFLRDGNKLARLLTEVLTEYNALGLGNLTQEELSPLVLQGPAESFVRNKAVAQAPKNFGGFTFSDAKLAEMIEIPDISGLVDAISSFDHWWKPIRSYSSNNVAFKHFQIVGDEVILSPESITEMEDRSSSYATTDAEKETYLVLHHVAGILNQLGEKHNFFALNRYGNSFPLYQEHTSGKTETKIHPGTITYKSILW